MNTDIDVAVTRTGEEDERQIAITLAKPLAGLIYKVKIVEGHLSITMQPTTGSKRLPAKSGIEREHHRNARALALLDIHEAAEFYYECHRQVRSFLSGNVVENNPFQTGVPEDKEVQNDMCLLASAWVAVSLDLFAEIHGTHETYFTHIIRFLVSVGMGEAIDGMQGGYRIPHGKRMLLETLCTALDAKPVEIRQAITLHEEGELG